MVSLDKEENIKRIFLDKVRILANESLVKKWYPLRDDPHNLYIKRRDDCPFCEDAASCYECCIPDGWLCDEISQGLETECVIERLESIRDGRWVLSKRF